MARVDQNFTTYIGNSERLQFTLTDANDDPLDITNITLKWRMAKHVLSTTTLISKASTTPTEISKDNLLGGICSVYLVPTDTAGNPQAVPPTTMLAHGDYYHELYMETPSGSHKTLATGKVTLKDSLFA